jgi:hypothetical protein
MAIFWGFILPVSILPVIGIINSMEKGVRIFGNAMHNGRTISRNARVREPYASLNQSEVTGGSVAASSMTGRFFRGYIAANSSSSPSKVGSFTNLDSFSLSIFTFFLTWVDNLHQTRLAHCTLKGGKKLAKKHYSKFLSSVRATFTRNCPDPRCNIIILVSQTFKINDLLQQWYEKYLKAGTLHADPPHYAFLFAPLTSKISTSIVAEEQLQVAKKWMISFEKTDESEGTRAGDEGGPTRQFFDRIWFQLGDINIHIPRKKKEISLFERTSGGLVLVTDEIIYHCWLVPLSKQTTKNCNEDVIDKERASTRKQIEAYFWAFGRFFAHTMLLSQEDFGGMITISQYVLPNLYKNGK